MQLTYLLVNVLGIVVYLGIALLFSNAKKSINWRSVAVVLVINLVLAWILTSFAWGRDAVKAQPMDLTGWSKLLIKGSILRCLTG